MPSSTVLIGAGMASAALAVNHGYTLLQMQLLLIRFPVLNVMGAMAIWVCIIMPVWRLLEEKMPWLFGNTHQLPGTGEDGSNYLIAAAQKHNRAFVLWYGPFKPCLAVTHPDTIKAILKTSEPKPMSFFGSYRTVFPWLGDGLMLTKGSNCFRNRRLFNPVFHLEPLKPYMAQYNDAVGIFLDQMARRCDTTSQEIEVYSPISQLTLNVMLRCTLAYDDLHCPVHGQGKENEYVQSVNVKTDAVKYSNPHLLFDLLFYHFPIGSRLQAAADYVAEEKVIKQRRDDRSRNPSLCAHRANKDFLDILLMARDQDGQGFSHAVIRDQVDKFLFVGHDPTASALAWLLYCLADHPDAQARARTEVDALMDDGRDSENIQWDDLSSMPYLYLCIREGLRMHHPVPLVGRKLEHELEVDGVTLQPGTMIDIDTYCIQHDEHVWGKDHNEFKPERFDNKNTMTMDPYAYIPFSEGPRNCVGQKFVVNEMKVALARTLRRFELAIVPDKRPKHQMSSVARTEDDMWLKLTPRGPATSTWL